MPALQRRTNAGELTDPGSKSPSSTSQAVHNPHSPFSHYSPQTSCICGSLHLQPYGFRASLFVAYTKVKPTHFVAYTLLCYLVAFVFAFVLWFISSAHVLATLCRCRGWWAYRPEHRGVGLLRLAVVVSKVFS